MLVNFSTLKSPCFCKDLHFYSVYYFYISVFWLAIAVEDIIQHTLFWKQAFFKSQPGTQYSFADLTDSPLSFQKLSCFLRAFEDLLQC